MDKKLVLVRHGESVWNATGTWTGLTDIELSPKGCEEAKHAAGLIRGIVFDNAFTSVLKRAIQTLEIIKNELGLKSLQITRDQALNERDYGIYTGKNKFEVKNMVGDKEFLQIRRGWDHPVPQGENLKQVYERVVPYYEKAIAPLIVQGKNILIVAHGNSLRALVKKLENISDNDIPSLELATGEVRIYTLDEHGVVVNREIKT
jgi:2,3-bisphosphoglycerate-dependent phosphoglycerate mutase